MNKRLRQIQIDGLIPNWPSCMPTIDRGQQTNNFVSEFGYRKVD